jgi:peptidoglycan hydrolase CwlO-like protein
MLVDIKQRKRSFYRTLPQVNLSYTRTIRIPVKAFSSVFLIFFFIISFIFNFVSAPTSGDVFAAVDKVEDRKALEAQLAQLEKEMDAYEKQITEYKKQGNTLQSEITRMNNQVAKLNLQIKSIMLTLTKVNKEIDSTTTQIGVTESNIDKKRRIIGEIVQDIYRNENQGVLLTLLADNDLSSFFTNLNNLASVSDQLKFNLDGLIGLHTELGNQKESLSLQKMDIQQLQQYQEEQRKEIQQTKAAKDSLLKVTKGKESEYQKVLAEKQKTAAQIRSRIFDLIGGGQMSFGDAYKYAKAAESATGVRAALLLAVLDGESALGKNVGRCNYKGAMHPTRDIPTFLAITKKLGMNPDTTLVSCAIKSDGAYGGAMGPSQFIPSTWVQFEAQIASLTGHNPPSPWNSQDAFTATALYLKGAGAANGTLYQEKVAAARYYAGGRWANYLSSYGARVINKAAQFEQDIATLTS